MAGAGHGGVCGVLGRVLLSWSLPPSPLQPETLDWQTHNLQAAPQALTPENLHPGSYDSRPETLDPQSKALDPKAC
eukprot:3052736-Rhodomonas_salina.3